MNWEAIGAIGDLIGGVGVVVSLVYLATQIRSAERTIRFELRDRHFSDWRDRWFTRSLNPARELEINRISLETQDELNPEDFAVWTTTIMTIFVEWQANYDLYREGIFTPEDFELLVKNPIANQFKRAPRTFISWERAKHAFFPSYFVEFVDQEISQIGKERHVDKYSMGSGT